MRFSFLLREYEKGFRDLGRLGAFFFCRLVSCSFFFRSPEGHIEALQLRRNVLRKSGAVFGFHREKAFLSSLTELNSY
jgi:hypothetical protein